MARISLLTTPWRLPLYLCSHGKLLGGKSSLAVKGIYSRLSKQVGDRGSISLAINSIVATVKNIGLTPQIIVQTIKNMLSIVRSILSTHASIASSVNVNNEKPCVGHQKRIASTTSARPQKHVFTYQNDVFIYPQYPPPMWIVMGTSTVISCPNFVQSSSIFRQELEDKWILYT